MQKKKVVIIGGGAAGYFCAANLNHPHLDIVILEKTTKLLSKVKVSGGGRCNVTNGKYDKNSEFASQYPRGKNVLKKTLLQFSFKDTISWFKSRGVELKMEPDGRMFPTTDNSQTIIDCLTDSVNRNHVNVITQAHVTDVSRQGDVFQILTKNGARYEADFVCVAIGGSPQDSHHDLFRNQLTIEPLIPSLFTFNLKNHNITELMGVSVPNATVKIQGTKLSSQGPLLITHWGLSGPAVLRLSAWGAKELALRKWIFNININWTGSSDEENIKSLIHDYNQTHKNKDIKNAQVIKDLPNRFWQYILSESDINPNSKLHELNKKQLNKLIHNLLHYEVEVNGKTTFKEEFVTAGGFSLNEINHQNFESKKIKHLYIIGECLDIDGITGGFNFQNAWTSGYIVAKDILRQL